MKRRTKRDITIFLGILVVIGGIAFANTQINRQGLAEDFEKLRETLEQKRVNSGIQLLRWNDVRTTKGSLQKGARFTDELKAYNGKEVFMIGFMVPDETFRDVNEFLMLPIPIECYFCQMPPQRDVLWIHLRPGDKAQIAMEPVLIRGTFTLHEGPGVKFFYSLENATFEAAEDGGPLTNKRLKFQHLIRGHDKVDDSTLLPGYTEKETQKETEKESAAGE